MVFFAKFGNKDIIILLIRLTFTFSFVQDEKEVRSVDKNRHKTVASQEVIKVLC